MAEKELYIYAVTRVHANETSLLSRQDLEQLAAAKNTAEAFRILADRGWGSPDLPPNDADALVACETERTWALMSELLDDLSPFHVFLIANDYHNLKAAVKLAYTAQADGQDNARYFQKYGVEPLDAIIKAANEHDFSRLPPAMADAGRQAYEVLAHTASGQQCDMVIDRAALVAIDAAGKQAGSLLLRRYAELTVDSANVKSAVRCCRMRKPREFCLRAIAPAGTLCAETLAQAAGEGMDAICAYLRATPYAGAVDALQTSMAEFERWCDNQLIALIKPQKNNYFTVEPLAAYILGRQNEIRMVRLVLSAKLNELPHDVLRERLRETYV